MTVAAGKKLIVGDKVVWIDDCTLGTVKEISYAAVKIQWNDDLWCLLTFSGPGTPWDKVARV